MAMFIAAPKDGKKVDLYADTLADVMEVVRPGVEVTGPYEPEPELVEVPLLSQGALDAWNKVWEANQVQEPEGGCQGDPD